MQQYKILVVSEVKEALDVLNAWNQYCMKHQLLDIQYIIAAGNFFQASSGCQLGQEEDKKGELGEFDLNSEKVASLMGDMTCMLAKLENVVCNLGYIIGENDPKSLRANQKDHLTSHSKNLHEQHIHIEENISVFGFASSPMDVNEPQTSLEKIKSILKQQEDKHALTIIATRVPMASTLSVKEYSSLVSENVVERLSSGATLLHIVGSNETTGGEHQVRVMNSRQIITLHAGDFASRNCSIVTLERSLQSDPWKIAKVDHINFQDTA